MGTVVDISPRCWSTSRCCWRACRNSCWVGGDEEDSEGAGSRGGGFLSWSSALEMRSPMAFQRFCVAAGTCSGCSFGASSLGFPANKKTPDAFSSRECFRATLSFFLAPRPSSAYPSARVFIRVLFCSCPAASFGANLAVLCVLWLVCNVSAGSRNVSGLASSRIVA